MSRLSVRSIHGGEEEEEVVYGGTCANPSGKLSTLKQMTDLDSRGSVSRQ